MKVLMVSSFLPYPLFSGGHVRLYNLIKELSKNHSITLVCEKRNYQTEKDINELKKFCNEVFVVERKKQWTFKNILESGFSTYPFLLVGHTNLPMKERIKELLNKKTFDLIHVETFYVMQNVPETYLPIVLVEHNIEYLVYSRFAKFTPLPLRPFLHLDVLKMKRWEQKFWQKATKLVAVSETEKKLMGRKDVEVVSNGADVKKFQISNFKSQISKIERRILFLGDFKWIQNRDAVEWILKEIWPSFVKASEGKPKAKLWIVGKNIPKDIKSLVNDSNIILDEDNKLDAQDIFRQADVLLAPIRIGGGTSFKILEAMASGTYVVTTPLGIEGIDAKNGKEVFIGDNAKDIANHLVSILEDFDKHKEVIKNARALIEKKYNWEDIAAKLEEVYKSAKNT